MRKRKRNSNPCVLPSPPPLSSGLPPFPCAYSFVRYPKPRRRSWPRPEQSRQQQEETTGCRGHARRSTRSSQSRRAPVAVEKKVSAPGVARRRGEDMFTTQAVRPNALCCTPGGRQSPDRPGRYCMVEAFCGMSAIADAVEDARIGDCFRISTAIDVAFRKCV